MIRLVEIMLFLLPFAAFAAWWAMAASGPPVAVVGGAACGLLLLAALLLWFAVHDTGGERDAYVPARLNDGRIVPGHAAQR